MNCLIEQAVDEVLLADAQRDIARALVLQNARRASPWDPLRQWRTAQNEDRLLKFGLVASIFGGILALALVVRGYTITGAVRPFHWVLLGVFVIFLTILANGKTLRQRLVLSLDNMLHRRAARLARPLSELNGMVLRYTVTAKQLRCEQLDEETASGASLRFERHLDMFSYALKGDATVVLFAKKKSMNPTAIVLTRVGDDAFSEALIDAHIEVEQLSPFTPAAFNIVACVVTGAQEGGGSGGGYYRIHESGGSGHRWAAAPLTAEVGEHRRIYQQ